MLPGAAPVSLKCTNCLKGIVGKHENVVSVQEPPLRMHFGKLTFVPTTYDRWYMTDRVIALKNQF